MSASQPPRSSSLPPRSSRSPQRRPGLRARLLAAAVAVSLPLAPAPVLATTAAPVLATQSSFLAALLADAGKVTPAQASSARKPIQDKAQGLLKAGDPDGAAELLAAEAVKRDDPVLHLDASEAFKAAGVKNKSKADLASAVDEASIGLDILYFLQDPRCDPDWQIVDSNEVSAEIRRGEKLIEDSNKASADLDTKAPAPPPVEEEKTRKKAPRDGRGLIAVGSVLTLVGIGGLGIMGAGLATGAAAQKDIDALADSLKNGAIDQAAFDAQKPDIDDKGKRGNVLTYAGIGVGAVGLAAGIALLVVGVKKRKKYRAEHGGASDSPSAMLLPALGRGSAGLVLSGRF